MPSEYECGKISVDGTELSMRGDATVTVAIPPSQGEQWRVEAFLAVTDVPPKLAQAQQTGATVRVVCNDVYVRAGDNQPAKRISGRAVVEVEPRESETYLRLRGEEVPVIEW
jgi:hypothetical protein